MVGVEILSAIASSSSCSEQAMRQLMDAKRQDLLRLRSIDVTDHNDDGNDSQRLKEEKARLARQQAIQVHFQRRGTRSVFRIYPEPGLGLGWGRHFLLHVNSCSLSSSATET